MHKIHEKEFTLEDFSYEQLDMDGRNVLEDTINVMNEARAYFNENKAKNNWWQMIQLLPSSYNQTRNVMMNYEVLANIYKSRKNHRLDEWVNFCKFIEKLPYSELICGDEFIDKVADKFCEIGNINPLSKEEINRIKEE